jgi:ParB family transcriptional regulator, chromosome partitioning protein
VAVSNLLRLLDLPDEALDLLEAGALTEGHGRALLLAPDHADRRLLAREAAATGWSVRELEARARGTAAPRVRRLRPRRASMDADFAEALGRVGEAIGAALGAEARVTPARDGVRVEVRLASLEEALALADRLARSSRGSHR